MLQFLHRALKEHQNRGDVGLVLEFYNPPPHEGLDSYNTLPRYDAAPRMTVFGTKVDVAQELGMGGAEAIDVLKDLETDEYLNLSYAGSGPYVDAGEVVVDFTEKGLNAIGVLPDPNEALLARLEDIAQALRACFAELKVEVLRYALGHEEDLRHRPFGRRMGLSTRPPTRTAQDREDAYPRPARRLRRHLLRLEERLPMADVAW